MRPVRTLSQILGAALLTTLSFGVLPAMLGGGCVPRKSVVVVVDDAPDVERIVSVTLPEPDGDDGESDEPSDVPEDLAAAEPAGNGRSVAPRDRPEPSSPTTARTPRSSARTTSPRAERSRSAGRGRHCMAYTDHIRELGATRWEVDQGFARQYTRDLGRLQTLAGVRRWEAPGLEGYRIVRIRCGSPLHQGGLRKGDIVHSVNGMPVTSSVKAAIAFARLRNKTRFRVVLTRGGERMVLRYSVV